MNILIVNKFLHPNGGSETYIFSLGAELIRQGHKVQYFGMEHEGRCVGNDVGAYTCDMDFHGGSKLNKLTYPIKTIYSTEARQKIRLVLDDFKPDAVHINNFNYQLTPSIILEIVKWRKDANHPCKIVYTAHDGQLVCPNHIFKNPITNEICEKCIGGNYLNCIKGRCIHGSLAKSVVGAAEAYFWKLNGAYKYIDTIICPSEFIKTKLDTNPLFAEKTVAIHNFIDSPKSIPTQKKDYVLYFGRYSVEKGISTLVEVCKSLPRVKFVFAGKGPLENEVNSVANIQNVGFKSGEELKTLISEALFTVCPSEWYEVYGLTIVESMMHGTPVIGANIGNIPYLIQSGKTGELFESGNKDELREKIENLWQDRQKAAEYSKNCQDVELCTVEEYCKRMVGVYSGKYE